MTTQIMELETINDQELFSAIGGSITPNCPFNRPRYRGHFPGGFWGKLGWAFLSIF
tara:strand:- start:15 stop:182 length:168 start_codon:yes stop_codon:yes gene_type:complete